MIPYETKVEAGYFGSFYHLGLKLATIAYETPAKIVTDVAGQTSGNLKVVCGPVLDQTFLDGQYSCMYVTEDTITGAHHVVIRGTNRDSVFSWMFEDFSVEKTKPFFHLPGLIPGLRADQTLGEVMISEGTWLGMTYLLNMQSWVSSAGRKLNAVEFLAHVKAKNVIVCGHSLGGTLTPPLYLYLNHRLNVTANLHCNMGLVSFAGLPPGGENFAKYFNSIFKSAYPWRVRNTLDIAPLMWLNLNDVLNIYKPYNLNLDDLDIVKGLLEHYFWMAGQADITYTQLSSGINIPGVFNTGFADDHFWAAQGAHQHATSTYKALLEGHAPPMA